MSLQAIHAIWHCDGCGCEFGTEIPEASTRPVKWSLFDIAEDSLLHGNGFAPVRSRDWETFATSRQGGKHLCGRCTAAEDAKHTDECGDDECDGLCLRKQEAEKRIAAGGCWVSPEIVEKLDLRRPGESVKEYAMRKGIR